MALLFVDNAFLLRLLLDNRTSDFKQLLSICGARRYVHIVPILTTLHWLPVRQRVTFKMAVMVWKCLHDVAPRDLADLCVPTAATAGRRQSRSAVSGALMVPSTRTSTGQRSFAVYCPRTRNRLPPALRLPELPLSSFRRQLETHLFQHYVCWNCSCVSRDCQRRLQNNVRTQPVVYRY